MAVFDRVLGDKPNQLSVTRSEDAPITAEQLLAPCEGERTEAGMRANIRVAVQYIEAWISGNGCVPIYGLMEDAATAEISRTSIWQWIHHQKTLNDGTPVTIGAVPPVAGGRADGDSGGAGRAPLQPRPL